MGKRRGRGEGSIEERGGKFRVIISGGFDPQTGKRRKMTATFDTKKEALAWRDEQMQQRRKGLVATAGKMTLGEWLDRWLEIRKPKVAPKTYDHDEGRVRNHIKPRLGSVKLGQLQALDVEAMLAKMAEEGHSSSERAKVGTVLRASLKAAVKAKLIYQNVAGDVDLPKVERPDKVCLERDQALALLKASRGHRLAAWFDTALDTGARPGELRALHWPDLDLVAGIIHIHQSLEERKGHLRLKATKTKKGNRRLKLAARTVEALRQHRIRMEEEGQDINFGPVFCDTQGGFLRESNFQRRAFDPLVQAAGLPPIRLYDLRHTCATLLLQAGVNLRVVSDRLGHESVELTLRCYVHALPSMQELAADAVDHLFPATLPLPAAG